jgi:acyl carrier protein
MSEQVKDLFSLEELQVIVVDTLQGMTIDWDLELEEGINSQTRLIEDLAFESIDIVQLVVALEQRLNRKNIPFEHLFMEEGDYVEDILVSEITEFLAAELKKPLV